MRACARAHARGVAGNLEQHLTIRIALLDQVVTCIVGVRLADPPVAAYLRDAVLQVSRVLGVRAGGVGDRRDLSGRGVPVRGPATERIDFGDDVVPRRDLDHPRVAAHVDDTREPAVLVVVILTNVPCLDLLAQALPMDVVERGDCTSQKVVAGRQRLPDLRRELERDLVGIWQLEFALPEVSELPFDR